MDRPPPERASLLVSSRAARLGLVLLGVVVVQFVLHGSALLGRKIMLPLDLLAQAGIYIPRTEEIARISLNDPALSDLINPHETARRFAHEEIFAGRLPLWQPHQFCGAPNIWPWYSPFLALGWSTASPVIWAWVHLFEALVAALGMYLFLRRVVHVGFWAAAIPSWCYPLTGFFVFWQGNPTGSSVFWLPWLLLTVEFAIRHPKVSSIAALAGVVALVLVSGHLDVAGQCLMVSALYAVWCSIDAHRTRWTQPPFRKALLSVGAGWVLGFCLASPYLLPVLEYSETGVRMARRSGGDEERPPGDLRFLPKVLVPDMHGSTRIGSMWLGPGNQIESTSAAYCGGLTLLLLAPLAWWDRQRRFFNVASVIFAVLGIAWGVGIPGMVALLRLPGVNMMSHNRLVFVTVFFLLCQAAIGFEALQRAKFGGRRWFWIPAVLVAGIFVWCANRAITLPEPIGTQVGLAVAAGNKVGWAQNQADVAMLVAWFRRAYGVPALLALAALAIWVLLIWGKVAPRRIVIALGTIMLVDLVWFASGRSPKEDPALYFPRVPMLDALVAAEPGRIFGYKCLPPTLSQACGLRDIRGYDGVDPLRLTEVLESVVARDAFKPRYASTQWFTPELLQGQAPDRVKLPPVLDMLGVTHVIFRGDPPQGIQTKLRSIDYWALVNPSAMPRAFVPRRVELEHDSRARLEKLSAFTFDPRNTAFVESQLELPGECRGAAKIMSDAPSRVVVSAEMSTPGLVVLGDRWDKGWKAYLGAKPVPILPVNHVLRGVLVPAGTHAIEFRYEPRSFRLGLWLAAAASLILGGSMSWQIRGRRRATGAAIEKAS